MQGSGWNFASRMRVAWQPTVCNTRIARSVIGRLQEACLFKLACRRCGITLGDGADPRAYLVGNEPSIC
jgi:hypothetical protein